MLHITQWDYADVVLLHITQLLYCSRLPICGTAQYYPAVALLQNKYHNKLIMCYLHVFLKCINIVNNDTEVIIVPGGKYWSEQRACDI